MATNNAGGTKGFCFAATVFSALCAVVAKTLIERRTEFQHALRAWYRTHARALPWRDEPSLYKTVVSEFMLQQTQVKTVLPYLARWLAELPDFPALAAAPEARVLKLWEGLGYYSRARNLHRLAQQVAAEPKHLDALLAFAARAWRRSLDTDERETLVSAYRADRAEGIKHDPAFRAALARVLSSPWFLYRVEQPAAGPRWQLVALHIG